MVEEELSSAEKLEGISFVRDLFPFFCGTDSFIGDGFAAILVFSRVEVCPHHP